jgi:hypothetical protein
MFTVSLSPKPAMLKTPFSLHEKVALLNFLLDVLKKIASGNFIKMKIFFSLVRGGVQDPGRGR